MKKQKTQTNRTKTQRLVFALVALVVVGGAAAVLWLNNSEQTGRAAYTPVAGFPDIHGLAVDPNDPKVLYVATHHGLIRGVERDGAWSWFLVGNYRADFMGFSMHPNGKTFYASGHKVPEAPLIGVARSDDGVAVDPQNPQVLYVSLESGLQRSTDGGQNWESMGDVGETIGHLAVDPTNSSVIYAATYTAAIYRSTDGGVSWRQIKPRG